jgi:hypothetical protein
MTTVNNFSADRNSTLRSKWTETYFLIEGAAVCIVFDNNISVGNMILRNTMEHCMQQNC